MQITRPAILVVDDEFSIRSTVEAILSREGYNVSSAADGQQAIEMVRAHRYDLVLTDLKMPNVDGLAVLEEVQKRSPDTVTIVLTGYGSIDSAIEAVQLGAYEYLVKPVEVPALQMAVRRSLERKRLSEIDTLYSIGRTLTRARDFASIANEVRDAVVRVLGIENASLIALTRDGAVHGGSVRLQDLVSSPALQDTLRDGVVLASDDEPLGQAADIADALGVRSAILVPGVAGERLVCVLTADDGSRPYEFHAAARRFLIALAGHAAMVIENALLISDLRANNEELQAANDKLRELDTLKSRFLSVATHELRTPLSIILGYNAMLAESLGDRLQENERETLQESVAACKRLIRLVNSMLDISQIESGKLPMNFAAADIRDLVQSVVTMFAHEARQRNVTLTAESGARLPRVDMDSERMCQVLVNLVANALKFTPAGGQVRIFARYRAETSALEVSVADTGAGIAAEDQPHVFEEFTPVARQASGQVHGLGLAIAKRIVEAHDGTLLVASTPGRGSTFTFSLPFKQRGRISQRAVPA